MPRRSSTNQLTIDVVLLRSIIIYRNNKTNKKIIIKTRKTVLFINNYNGLALLTRLYPYDHTQVDPLPFKIVVINTVWFLCNHKSTILVYIIKNGKWFD